MRHSDAPVVLVKVGTMLVQILSEVNMAHKWVATKFKGIRYREHSTRMHGRQKDRYFNIRFRVAGVSVNEGFGWASEGMSASKAALLIAELKEELRTGKGTGKLSDRRKAKQIEQEETKKAERLQKQMEVSYNQYFKEFYLPTIQGKKPSTLTREVSLHKYWIIPVLGRVLIKNICELHLKKVKLNMEKGNLAPRTVEYAFACIRMVMSHAIENNYHQGINPIKKLKLNDKPKFDNRRTRFFPHKEADQLLQALSRKSVSVYNMTILSMHCGLRAGEIFSLTWGDVDLSHGLLTLRETKSGRNRTVNMTEEVLNILRSLPQGQHGELVFPNTKGKKRREMSKTFQRTVDGMGMNDGVTDIKQKLTFHSCRHTCASWLVMSGVPLFTVQKILGHSTISMTERYAHLAPKEFKAAVNLLEKGIKDSRAIRDTTNNVVNIK